MPTVKTCRVHTDAAVHDLLATIRQRFYAAHPPTDFHRDRRMLVYALTWPATWLEQRSLSCSSARYRALIECRLRAVEEHGDRARYGHYFPAYFLHCLQDWFQHHGDDLYDELKHVRNALDQILASVRFATAVQTDDRHIAVLASAHRLIAPKRKSPSKSDSHQLSLF